MKENVVNFEAEYFLKKENEGQKAILDNDFTKVLDILKEPLEKIDNMQDIEMYCPQNIFDAAIFLNYLGKDVKQTSFSKVNYYDFYLMAASSHYNLGHLKEARDYYRKAIRLNPASSIARIFELTIDKELGEYDSYISNIQDALYFAYNRSDLATIYSLAGDFLAHEKDFEMAIVAYNLSVVYDLKDDTLDLISNVAKEGNIDLDSEDWLSETYMKKFYNTYKIPLMPNEKLSELASAMGDDAFHKKAYGVAKYAYKVAYELTYDEKIKAIIDEIEKKSNKVF